MNVTRVSLHCHTPQPQSNIVLRHLQAQCLASHCKPPQAATLQSLPHTFNNRGILLQQRTRRCCQGNACLQRCTAQALCRCTPHCCAHESAEKRVSCCNVCQLVCVARLQRLVKELCKLRGAHEVTCHGAAKQHCTAQSRRAQNACQGLKSPQSMCESKLGQTLATPHLRPQLGLLAGSALAKLPGLSHKCQHRSRHARGFAPRTGCALSTSSA